ncbi:DUF2852 domain-containing protein [Antarcticimicrobium luteum]|uniref:DUF2852 domain-containing protein n=1 Tax=Antarcticimicrobium luteum TaxID=2547397 RepID=A0A4R5VEF9_9RHOB|nr:DUF2852 domain-containing protein [Antarcticimicrobium luteum]TDK50792.1 DUF2852 domain-containing protein [Antarcticimicrobium luteum]
MTTFTDAAPAVSRPGWLARTEAWFDDKGKGAWIAAMVLGFILFWPIGLALLAYMIWSKRMFSTACRNRHQHRNYFRGMGPMTSTGNTAFDSYKTETLRRLEQEQMEFEAFLERLREAKDKSEFDQFMDARARRAADETRRGDALEPSGS